MTIQMTWCHHRPDGNCLGRLEQRSLLLWWSLHGLGHQDWPRAMEDSLEITTKSPIRYIAWRVINKYQTQVPLNLMKNVRPSIYVLPSGMWNTTRYVAESPSSVLVTVTSSEPVARFSADCNSSAEAVRLMLPKEKDTSNNKPQGKLCR